MTPIAMPAVAGGGLRGRHLLVDEPLHPHVEVDERGVRLAEGGDGGRRRVPELGRPAAGRPWTSLIAHQVAKSRRPEPSTAQNASYSARALGGQPRLVDRLEGRPLGPPDGVAVEQVGGEVQLAQLARPAARRASATAGVSARVLRDVLDAQVHRVGEAPRDGQVRRRRHRRHRRRRVQRVDEDEAGAELASAPRGQRGEVVQVAHAPRLRRAHRVDLRHEAPLAVAGDRVRVEAVRRHDERRRGPRPRPTRQ